MLELLEFCSVCLFEEELFSFPEVSALLSSVFFSVTDVSVWLIREEDSVALLGTEASLSFKDSEVLSVSCIKSELKEEDSGVSSV